ncbi:uncharacterized protein GLRG_10526 [Colletotrichum graminicola M1.001]|uniref:DUF6546 domain-containing protein n=1 Tax=Colletotrichum graminicola (strain M1.001 / M2 / FGSC 10212) TaxID=645133 RepID=E3QWZ4_COLGM|nr:uncharacterized protein GLRG_10526 [Colletotrichum graminicola M1.001]EFQ35382.1 hypothetical protein GLRG_10526 [Colletotrichum graminicola M1.001]
MFARFPRLQAVYYEHWREWSGWQNVTDRGYQHLFESIQRCNDSLKRLVVFENFNQQYPAIAQRFRGEDEYIGLTNFRKPNRAISQMVALASLKLEHLAASFIADASYFLEIHPTWKWPNLTSLVLTSKLLTPHKDPIEIGAMLRVAAAC